MNSQIENLTNLNIDEEQLNAMRWLDFDRVYMKLTEEQIKTVLLNSFVRIHKRLNRYFETKQNRKKNQTNYR
jgi:hypothetical protein